jgi:rhodanese-related sulfurtransferase
MRRSIFILALTAGLGIGSAQQGKNITTEELEKYLEQKDKIFFLDVREPKEIAELGSVEGYVNIPLGELEKRLGEIPKDKLIITL